MSQQFYSVIILVLNLQMYSFYLGAQAAPGVDHLCTTLPLVAPHLVPAVRGILPLVDQGAALTVADQPADLLPPPVCLLTPVWEQS